MTPIRQTVAWAPSKRNLTGNGGEGFGRFHHRYRSRRLPGEKYVTSRRLFFALIRDDGTRSLSEDVTDMQGGREFLGNVASEASYVQYQRGDGEKNELNMLCTEQVSSLGFGVRWFGPITTLLPHLYYLPNKPTIFPIPLLKTTKACSVATALMRRSVTESFIPAKAEPAPYS